MHALLKGRRFRIGAGSSLVVSTVSLNVLRIGSSMCLTRLLAPDVFGISGAIMSVFFVIAMLSDVGFQAYIVRHERGEEPAFLDAVWTIHALRGVGQAVITVLLAWPLAMLLHKPELAVPLAGSALIFVIEGQVSLNQFVALRTGRVQQMALFDFLVAAGQAAAMILLAYLFHSIWAILIAMMLTSSVKVVMSHVLFPGHRQRFRRDREIAGDLWRFSRAIAASSLLSLIILQVDKLTLARVMPLSELGKYVIATNISSAANSFAFNYAARIVYPAVANAWREKASIADAYYQSWSRAFYLYLFGGGGLITSSGLLIHILYDPRYFGAARYLSILAISSVMRIITHSMQEALIAIGNTRTTFELNVVRLVWLIGSGLLAFIERSPITLIWAIGLMEPAVYLYTLRSFHRLGILRPRHEMICAATLAAGMATGAIANGIGLRILSSL